MKKGKARLTILRRALGKRLIPIETESNVLRVGNLAWGHAVGIVHPRSSRCGHLSCQEWVLRLRLRKVVVCRANLCWRPTRR